ncbi:MAG TPA: hypothetical protein PLD23_02985 [Armatimonadota bacterium]|nr:hypothetical protein [Armatimonadota bacterium]
MSSAIRMGWAHRDITPNGPVAIRGQFNLRIATRIEDPLTLTALALEAGDDHVILVSIDSCTADQQVIDDSRAALAQRLPDVEAAKLIVCGTHTHTAPFASAEVGLQREEDYLAALRERYPDYVTTAEYSAQVTEALVDAVCDAWNARTEGHIGFGYAHAVVGENRRVRYFDNRAQMYGSTSTADFSHIEGHVDHSVNLLCTYDSAQHLTGVLMNIACPAQASESGQDYVSADFWHDVREELGRRHGAGLFVLPQCSAAGDQSPHRLIATRAEDRMLRLKYGGRVDRPLNTTLRRDIAQRLADAFDGAEPVLRRDLRDQAVLKHEYRRLSLPHWDVTDTEYAALQEEMGELGKRLEELAGADPLSDEVTATRCKMAWCRRAADRYERPLPGVPIETHIVRLGDIAFVTAPFEYYLDFGDRIKGRSPALQTFIVQLTGNSPYLATERAAAGLSYGAVPASCLVSPAGGQVLVDEAIATLSAMFAE